MKRLIPLLSTAVIVLFGCKPEEPVKICDPAPAPSLSDFVFRVVDKNGAEELLVPGKLNPDSVSVSQACNSNTNFPVRHYSGYLANENDLTGSVDSSKVVQTFVIDNLKPTLNNEGAECEYVYIRWNSMDRDTLRLSYSGDGCTTSRIVTVTFNGAVVPESINWVTFQSYMRTYYQLEK